MNIDLFGNTINDKTKLKDWFIIPPFSVFNVASQNWQDRKKKWMGIINDKAQARQNKLRDSIGIPKAIEFMLIKGDTTSILDPVLCEVLLHWFTQEHFKIFDPFAGDSVFGFCSSYKNRPFVGIELRSEQVEFNQNKIDEYNLPGRYICDDAINIDVHIPDNSMDFMFTCPPYADLEIYSDLPNDLSNMGYHDFFDTIEHVLTKTYNKLKENRFAVIVIGEVRHRDTGEYIGLVPRIIQIMINAGYKYYNECILVTPIGNLQMRAGRYMNANRKIGKQHQNVIVFYKGDVKNISKHFNKLKDDSADME